MATREELIAEAQRRGLTPPPDKSALLAEAERRGLQIPQASQPEPMSKWEAIKQGASNAVDFVQGNDEFQEAGNIQDYINTTPRFGLNKEGFSLAASSMFGNDDDLVKRFQEFNPNVEIKADNTGNRYFEKNGERFYFNRGGVDVGDAVDVAGEAGTYLAGGLLTAPIKGTGTRMAATGVTEAAINAANQKAAGREDIDGGEVLTAGAFGAAAEGLAPLVSKAWRWVRNQDMSNLQAGQVIAKQMGADLNQEQLERLGDLARNLDPEQVSKESILSHIELNQRPTAGTLTGNQKLLRRENQLRSAGLESTKDKFELLDNRNAEGLQKAVSDYTPGTSSKLQGADQVGVAVRDKASQMKSAADEAWDNIPNATAKSEPITNAADNIRMRFENSGFYIDPDLTPAASKALDKVSEFSKKLETQDAIDWNRINLERKRLGGLFNSAKTAEDRKALGMVKEEFEKTYKEAFENHLLSGDPDVMKSLDNAVQASKDYFDMFKAGKGDPGGKAVESWLADNVPPENIANAFFTKNSGLKQHAIPVMRKLKSVLGEDSEGFRKVQEMAIQGLMDGKNKATLRTSLKNALTDNPTFMNELFDKKQLNFMSRTLSFLNDTKLDGIAGRSSGTAERIFDWVTSATRGDVSLNGVANLVKRGLGTITGHERRLMTLPYEQLKNNPTAGAAVAIQNQTSGQ